MIRFGLALHVAAIDGLERLRGRDDLRPRRHAVDGRGERLPRGVRRFRLVASLLGYVSDVKIPVNLPNFRCRR